MYTDEIGDINWGRWVMWSVADMSTAAVPQVPKIRVMISGWRLHSVVMGCFGRDQRLLSLSDSLECAWP